MENTYQDVNENTNLLRLWVWHRTHSWQLTNVASAQWNNDGWKRPQHAQHLQTKHRWPWSRKVQKQWNYSSYRHRIIRVVIFSKTNKCQIGELSEENNRTKQIRRRGDWSNRLLDCQENKRWYIVPTWQQSDVLLCPWGLLRDSYFRRVL